MALENLNTTNFKTAKQEDDFNIQRNIGYILHFWWLFLIFLIVSLTCAFLYNRYSTPKYKVSAKILVKDTKKGSGNISNSALFDELGLLGGQNSVDNEVELLKSRTLMENTVNAEQLNVRYFEEGKVKLTEISGQDLSITIKLYNLKEDSLVPKQYLDYTNVDNGRFKFIYGKEVRTGSFGDTISFSFGKIVVNEIQSSKKKLDGQLKILIDGINKTVAYFSKKLNVAVTGKAVTTIDLTLEDQVPSRGELLLNALIRIYNQMNIEDKNQVADSTITFINNRLGYVTSELGEVEKNIEQFRQQNKLTDLSEQGKLLLENSSEYFKKLSETEVQISIVNSLENYLKNDQNSSRTIPPGLVIQDPTFASLIEKYNSLQLEKERQLQTTLETNPVVQRLVVQVNNLKSDIIANLGTIKRSLEITKNQLRNRTNSFESQISQVPRKERAFLEISRQQAIKQELYLYLLKKREETAVSKAANIDNARIVDSAKSEVLPFSPNKSMTYVTAALLGLILPGFISVIGTLVNNKIKIKKDVTNATSVPIVGEIGRSPSSNNLLIKENSRHPVSEQLRLLRTNLDYIAADLEGSKAIMLTSSMSGEGKSFLSLNLSAVLALGGKRVVLLEFDLRKPKLSSYLGFENNDGISRFLVKKTEDILTLTREVPGIDNLFFIGSGPIPPNPAELINSEQIFKLFSKLRSNFDYIIVDVPPVGVVADALLLSNHVDITLYVIRQNYTFKSQLELVEDLYQQKKMPKMGIIVNAIKQQKGPAYGYGYGYGYGYAYGYGYGYNK